MGALIFLIRLQKPAYLHHLSKIKCHRSGGRFLYPPAFINYVFPFLFQSRPIRPSGTWKKMEKLNTTCRYLQYSPSRRILQIAHRCCAILRCAPHVTATGKHSALQCRVPILRYASNGHTTLRQRPFFISKNFIFIPSGAERLPVAGH